MNEHYGKLDAEKLANDKLLCRRIVTEINNFGVSDAQKLFIVYILSLELENVEASHDLAIVAKSFCEAQGMLLGK